MDTPIGIADTTHVDTNPTQDTAPLTPTADTPIDLWSEGHPAEQQDLASTPKYDAKNDPKRVEYWQSQADKRAQILAQREAEYQAKEQQFAELQQLDAYLRSNPQVVEKLRGELGADSPKADAGLAKPQKPVAPEGFNELEAYQDPNSASWKHRKALEDYRDKLDSYYEKKEQLQQLEAQQAYQAQMQQAQYQSAIRQTHALLQQQHGLRPEEAQEFIQMFSDDKSITLDNLVKLYRTIKQPAAPGRQEQRFQTQSQRARIPAPVSQASAFSQPDISEEDEFNMGLFNAARGRRG